MDGWVSLLKQHSAVNAKHSAGMVLAQLTLSDNRFIECHSSDLTIKPGILHLSLTGYP